MSRTADEITLRIPWCDARKRAGTFEALRQYFHQGLIFVIHRGLRRCSDGELAIAGPGIINPRRWFTAHEDRLARRVVFITDTVEFGTCFREELFAYVASLEVDSVAFDAFFPAADLPPAEQAHPRPQTTQAEPVIADPAPASAASPANPGGRHDRDLVLEEAEPVIADPASAASAASPVKGGRPTDRDPVLEEAGRRLKHQQVPKTLAAFARELHAWLEDYGRYRTAKTGEVMKAKTIEDHVRPLWKAHKAKR